MENSYVFSELAPDYDGNPARVVLIDSGWKSMYLPCALSHMTGVLCLLKNYLTAVTFRK